MMICFGVVRERIIPPISEMPAVRQPSSDSSGGMIAGRIFGGILSRVANAKSRREPSEVRCVPKLWLLQSLYRCSAALP